MLEAIRKFFQDEVAPTDGEGVDEHRLQVATCALMLEIAWADETFSDEERDSVAALMRDRFDLDASAAETLLDLARSERDQSTDLYQFTRLIKDELPRQERLRVLEALWTVVYSDGVLEAHEDAMVHKLARLLGLKHEEAIALKLRARDLAG
ncbi:TerB family tellurite resistance protein [bacterium]|nr:TerB family tellurite resistance protein [bacterium]